MLQLTSEGCASSASSVHGRAPSQGLQGQPASRSRCRLSHDQVVIIRAFAACLGAVQASAAPKTGQHTVPDSLRDEALAKFFDNVPAIKCKPTTGQSCLSALATSCLF